MLIDTTGVGLEIVIHGHGHGDGTLLHDFLLDVAHTLNTVRGRSKVLVRLVGSAVGGL